jgi:hypothetical protein
MYFVRDMIIDLCSADSVLLKVEMGMHLLCRFENFHSFLIKVFHKNFDLYPRILIELRILILLKFL